MHPSGRYTAAESGAARQVMHACPLAGCPFGGPIGEMPTLRARQDE
jgi:hypothetical protein